MKPPFRLFGVELSPYSVKVRAYLRFKGIEHAWCTRTAANSAEIAGYSRLPLIPVLVDATDRGTQDSTAILDKLEAAFPEPAAQPQDVALAFISRLLEDYADEWLNKAMFHYRWSHAADQQSAAERIVADLYPGGSAPEGAVEAIRTRMTGRLHMVGSNAETGAVIERSFRRLIDLLEVHLAGRDYLFGGAPCMADFGLYGQLAQLLSDPTSGALMRAHAPRVAAWVERMLTPEARGGYEPIEAMRSTLLPLLRLEIAGAYLPWMDANAAAIAAGTGPVSLEIDGIAYTQGPQKYAAKAFAELRRKRAAAGDDAALAALLEETGCAALLPYTPPQERPAFADDGEDDNADAAPEAATLETGDAEEVPLADAAPEGQTVGPAEAEPTDQT